MKIAIVATFSAGSVLPLLALARSLQFRGHEPIIFVNDCYLALAERVGVPARSLISAEVHRSFLNRMQTYRKLKLRFTNRDLVAYEMRPVFSAIDEYCDPTDSVIVAQAWCFGARVARDALQVPLLTVHLQPRGLFPEGHLTPRELATRRRYHKIAHRLIDRFMGEKLNPFRAELGLPPATGILEHWWNSPDRVVGLFPHWFVPSAGRQIANYQSLAFPRFAPFIEPLEQEEERLERFLAAGNPPIVFTHSAASADVKGFLKVSLEIARRTGHRAIFLSSRAEQFSKELPASAMRLDFVSLDRLLPRVAAHIHHGGIGTIGYSLAAGIPQVTVPSISDQMDNSKHLARLGVSVDVPLWKYWPRIGAGALHRVTNSPELKQKAAELARYCYKDGDGVELLATEVEAMGSYCRSHKPCLFTSPPISNPKAGS